MSEEVSLLALSHLDFLIKDTFWFLLLWLLGKLQASLVLSFYILFCTHLVFFYYDVYAKSSNTISQSILNSDALYTSQMYQHWRSVLISFCIQTFITNLESVLYHWINVLYNVFESNVYVLLLYMDVIFWNKDIESE